MGISFRIVKNATIANTAAFGQGSNPNSAMMYDTTAQAAPTGGVNIKQSTQVAGLTTIRDLDTLRSDLGKLLPGETLSFVAQSLGNNATVRVDVSTQWDK